MLRDPHHIMAQNGSKSRLAIYLVGLLALFLMTSINCHVSKTKANQKFMKQNSLSPNISVSLVQFSRDQIADNYHNSVSDRNHTPLVMWHGMGDWAFGSVNIAKLALERLFPGIPIFSVQIGKDAIEDELSGYFVNVNHQVELVCKLITTNQIIKKHGSFNCIGYSQGAQFLRAVIQRCPLRENGIRVKNFISLGGQHQGVFGLPRCNHILFCDHIRFLLTNAAYEQSVQEHLVQAEYWHDPLRENVYKTKNIFLADINNELQINRTYKDNLLQLDNFVLVRFKRDTMVIPNESSLFGFYKSGSTSDILPFNDTSLYREDKIGLRKLNDTNRLKIIETDGDHLQYTMNWFVKNVALIYLDN